MKRPPLPIVLVAVPYLAYLAWTTATDFSATDAGRLVFSVVLFFFVLRGSRTAGNILAVLCAVSSVLLLVAAVAALSTDPLWATVFCIVAVLLLAFAAYLIFSPIVRVFQGKTTQAAVQ